MKYHDPKLTKLFQHCLHHRDESSIPKRLRGGHLLWWSDCTQLWKDHRINDLHLRGEKIWPQQSHCRWFPRDQDSSCCKTRAFSAYNVHPAVQPNINFFLGSLNGRHLEQLEIDEIENLWSFPFPRSFGMFGIKEDAAYLFYPFLCSVYLPLQEG